MGHVGKEWVSGSWGQRMGKWVMGAKGRQAWLPISFPSYLVAVHLKNPWGHAPNYASASHNPNTTSWVLLYLTTSSGYPPSYSWC